MTMTLKDGDCVRVIQSDLFDNSLLGQIGRAWPSDHNCSNGKVMVHFRDPYIPDALLEINSLEKYDPFQETNG